MWKWKSDWGCCLGGAYFLAKFQAGGSYSSGAYKKSVYDSYNPRLLKKPFLPEFNTRDF